jgi:hypothetical protein
MSESRGVALAILGIVALIAVVGLVLLFSGRTTGQVTIPGIYGGYGADKTYGGWERAEETTPRGDVGHPYQGSYVKGVPTTWEGQTVAVVGGSQATYREPSRFSTNCPPDLDYYGSRQAQSLSDDEWETCITADDGLGMCCRTQGVQPMG